MIIRKVNELLYSRINDWDWTGHADSFTKKEIDSIKNQISEEVDYCKVTTSNEILGRGANEYAEITIRKGDITNHFGIYKLIDEWYIVSWKGNYWKCDQIDGLISCILENIVKSDIRPRHSVRYFVPIKENTNGMMNYPVGGSKRAKVLMDRISKGRSTNLIYT